MQVVTTLHDADGSTFSSTALPTSLDGTVWAYINDVSMIFRDPNDLANQRSLHGTLTFASVTIPEPASLLLGLAAAWLAGLQRRLSA